MTSQIAFSTVLLVLAGLFAHSLVNIAREDLGIDVGSLVSFSVAPLLNGYDAERAEAIYDRIEEQLAAQPGVVSVGTADWDFGVPYLVFYVRGSIGSDALLSMIPRVVEGVDGSVNRIIQRGDTISLLYGQHGFTRTIHMDLAEHPEDLEPSRAGHSIGRWEDDVLIVDTVGFLPGLLTGQTLHSDQLHVVERFSLDSDSTALTRAYTAEDPLYFVGQLTGSDTLYVADAPYEVHECKELMNVDYAGEDQAGSTTLDSEERDE